MSENLNWVDQLKNSFRGFEPEVTGDWGRMKQELDVFNAGASDEMQRRIRNAQRIAAGVPPAGEAQRGPAVRAGARAQRGRRLGAACVGAAPSGGADGASAGLAVRRRDALIAPTLRPCAEEVARARNRQFI